MYKLKWNHATKLPETAQTTKENMAYDLNP